MFTVTITPEDDPRLSEPLALTGDDFLRMTRSLGAGLHELDVNQIVSAYLSRQVEVEVEEGEGAEGDTLHPVRGLDLTIAADPHTREVTLTDQDGATLTLAFSEAVGLYHQLVQMEDTPAQRFDVLIPGGWVLSGATGSGKSKFLGDLRFMLAQLDSLDAPGAHQI